jgi:PDZ domain-containing protein
LDHQAEVSSTLFQLPPSSPFHDSDPLTPVAFGGRSHERPAQPSRFGTPAATSSGASMAKYRQTMIPRETRLLLLTIVVSVVALWLLARVRFQDRPVTADPVPPVLAQLRPQSSFDDLARLVADMRTTIGAWTFALDGGYPALRIRENMAVTLAPVEASLRSGFDRPTGLAIVKSAAGELSGLMPWVPRVLDYPRYLIAAEFLQGRLALRPQFVSGLFPASSPIWGGEIWRVPEGAAIRQGTFVFTTDGALAGLAVRFDDGIALVPATHLLRMIDDLLSRGARDEPAIGVSVQPLTSSISAATGATAGMVVTAVDPGGPAAGVVRPTDVIEQVNGETVPTVDHWRAIIERLSVGENTRLRLRRSGGVQDVDVPVMTASRMEVAKGVEDAARKPALGLRLRTLPGVGTQVVAVAPTSSAGIAGVRAGDVITLAGQLNNPTGAQVISAFEKLDSQTALLVALTRGDEHHVVALSR